MRNHFNKTMKRESVTSERYRTAFIFFFFFHFSIFFKCWNVVKNLNDFDLEVEENSEKDEDAKLIIMSSITDKVLRKIHKPTANEMWEALVKKYEDKDGKLKFRINFPNLFLIFF